MTGLLRITGFLLILAGAVIVLTWFIEPLRKIWPYLLQMPLPLRIGFSVAGVGLIVIMATLIWERWNEREDDRDLLDD